MEIPESIKKLGIQTFFGFVLHFTPKSYTNSYLSQTLEANTQVVLKIEVLKYFSYKAAKVLCYAPLFDREIELVIFNPKSYHKNIFIPGEHLIISGKIQKNGGYYTLIQPKILKSLEGIFPNFGTRGTQESLLRDFSKNISLQSLQSFYPRIPIKYLKALLMIYQPNLDFFESFQKQGGFFGDFLDALKFVEIYEYMRKLKTKKREFQSLKSLQGEIEGWIDSLPFKLTLGQMKAIYEIKQSLASNKAARRVIIGDVGCGKTLVIFASVLMAYPNKSLLMAPTSILARQIYEESQKFLPPFIKVALFTQGAKEGDLHTSDFLIGSHALLYQDLQDYSLVMIDEQHRFGTAQRNTLERKFEKDLKRPHILQFSATPIPRTLAMVQSNFLDFSFIEDLPYKKDIDSEIIHKQDFKKLLAHIHKEIVKGYQIIIVYPLVEEGKDADYVPLKEGEIFWKKHFQGVYVTHGKDKAKELVLEEFRDKGNILLATTLIEVGISLPKLSTIVIVGAERLGLATLHQLRGRVSRNGLKGYCFLYTNKDKIERLERFCQIQNGFEIAKLDLQYRNSGDLLNGEQQSGKQFLWISLSSDESIIKIAKESLGG